MVGRVSELAVRASPINKTELQGEKVLAGDRSRKLCSVLASFISSPDIPQLLPKMLYFQNTVSFEQIQTQP